MAEVGYSKCEGVHLPAHAWPGTVQDKHEATR